MEQATNGRKNLPNPYAAENRAAYKMGKVETFLHNTLGFRTGIDKYNEEMDNAAAAWQAQQANNAYEEEYNDAASQAARMQEAGINPDLAHNQIEPGQATEFTEPEAAPESPAGIDIEAFQRATEISAKIASIALDAITGSAGIFSTITNAATSLGNYAIEKDTKEANLGKTLREMVMESYGEVEPIISGMSNLSGGAEWAAKTFGGAGDFLAKARGLSGKNRKKFAFMYDSTINSATAKIKSAQKIGEINMANANPAVAAPYLYKQIEMQKVAHDAAVYDILLEKARLESQVLQENTELFKGMTVAEMRNTIHKAVISGNEAEISKYNKVIARLDKIDREAEQKQRDKDREFIHNWIPVDNWKAYQQANQRLYGITPEGITVFGQKFQ